MFAGFRKIFSRWFGFSRTKENTEHVTSSHIPEPSLNYRKDPKDTQPASELVPYDENLLERARTQWQFGDWESLAKLDKETLQHHPDRAKLALLAAAGHLQLGNTETARQFVRLAQDWGIRKKFLTRILIAGVYNNLGRAAAVSGNHSRALAYFENAVGAGTPGVDFSKIRIFTDLQISEFTKLKQLPALKNEQEPREFETLRKEILKLKNDLWLEEKKKELALRDLTILRTKISKRNSREKTIRTIHHFACTGGTIISKAIASMPHVLLLSELDPLSSLDITDKKQPFSPSDPIRLLKYNHSEIDPDVLVDMFVSSISKLEEYCSKRLINLLLRDHTHSHYCTGKPLKKRKTFREFFLDNFFVKSIVTVRDPIESYISLKKNNWIHFNPCTFDEYCHRYNTFLNDYKDVSIFKYEDFVEHPKKICKQICEILEIDFDDNFMSYIPLMNLSGDSGRSSHIISKRSTKRISEELKEEINQSQQYKILKTRLNY